MSSASPGAVFQSGRSGGWGRSPRSVHGLFYASAHSSRFCVGRERASRHGVDPISTPTDPRFNHVLSRTGVILISIPILDGWWRAAVRWRIPQPDTGDE